MGMGAYVALLAKRSRFDASGTYLPTSNGYVRGSSSLGGSVGLVAGSVRACYSVLREPLELSPCVGFEGGSILSGTGFSTVSATTRPSPWLAPMAGFTSAVPLGRGVAVVLDVDALVPLLESNFVLEKDGTKDTPSVQSSVYQVSRPAGRLGVGVEVRF